MIYVVDYDFTYTHLMAFSAIFLGGLLVIRPISNKFKYKLYFATTTISTIHEEKKEELITEAQHLNEYRKSLPFTTER